MEENYKHPALVHLSRFKMQLDIWIPALKVAFEYQGEQHYKPVHWMGKDLAQQQTRDEEKKRARTQVKKRA